MISKRIFNLLESIKYDEAFKFLKESLKESIKEEVRMLVSEYEEQEENKKEFFKNLDNYINNNGD